MHRAMTALAAALSALAVTTALALAQGVEAPEVPELTGERPTPETLYEDGHGARYLMGGDWYFRLDPGDGGEIFGFHLNPSLDGWTPVTIPNAWNATDLSDDSQRGSVGWYRRDFRLPRSGGIYRWKLRFESVNYRAKVWLNGRLLGEHEGAYVPFEFPTAGLNRKGVNTLVVRVDSRRTNQDVPRGGDRANGRPTGGWWNYGGLLREVYLRRFEGVDIETVRVRPVLSEARDSARLDFRIGLSNPTPERRVFRLRVTVDGVTRQSAPIALRAGRTLSKYYRVRVEEPRLWQVLAPELYPIEIHAVDEEERTLSSYSLNVGIRDLAVGTDGLLRVNGRVVKLYGASLHEDHPLRGAALLPEDRERDMRLLRELGATITRAHYPIHPHYLELADRMGLVIYDQIPVYGFGYKGFTPPGITEKSLAFVQAMVERDWNHPSVFVWSIGNELAHRMTPDLETYIRKATRLVNRLDPTRLKTLDVFGYPQTPPADVYYELDGIGINNYFGWYPGPNGQTEDRELLGPYLDQMHEYYPDMALFVTEFGAEANRGGSVEQKGTYEFQQDFLRDHIETYMSKPYLNGAVNWILRDFRVRPDWEGGNPRPEPPYNQKGLADENYKRKPAFDDVAELFKSVRVVR